MTIFSYELFFSFSFSDQSTALHCACEKGHVDVVEYLLDHGALIQDKGPSKDPINHLIDLLID